jgi:hypothetical protein
VEHLQSGAGEFKLRLPSDGTRAQTYCNDAAADDPECPYHPRIYSDLARRFIERHKDEPFFLVVSLTAVHQDHRAPARTKDHYRKNGPVDRKVTRSTGYWALHEEIDAAVGRVLQMLDDTETTRFGGPEEKPLRDGTLVLFVADQGPEGSSRYGDPILRGAKFSVFDGGLRVPFLAQACAADPTPLAEAGLWSQVDLFPTIAEAAGAPVDEFGTLRSCENDQPAVGCQSCSLPQCPERFIDGKSFYPVLQRETPPETRSRVFAQHAKSIAVVGGTDGTNVCAYHKEVAQAPDPGSATFKVRGASCTTCTNPAPESTECNSKSCRVLGKRCVQTTCSVSTGTACTKNAQCPPGETCNLRPCKRADGSSTGQVCAQDKDCNRGLDFCVYPEGEVDHRACLRTSDCDEGYACRRVSVTCNDCLPAAWKLKTNTHTKVGQLPSNAGGLFDLNSNPEEDAGANCALDVTTNSLLGTFCDLDRRVQEWACCSEQDRMDLEDVPKACEEYPSGTSACLPLCDARCAGLAGCAP